MFGDPQLMRTILLSVSVFLSFLFFPYGLNFYVLMRRAAEYKAPTPKDKRRMPVTIQLPVFNERYVVDRLVTACTKMIDRYGRNLVQILVLDDSTDDTTKIAGEVVQRFKKQGYDIDFIHRENRDGFKAGALQNALPQTKHPFIAIFDADFVPPDDFLDRVMPHFSDEQLSMVQTKWGHINRNYNMVTKAISIGYDGHHLLEQTGRYAANYLLNFNGAAGIIRRAALEQAGGWQPDTLAEDLDLSYRMQLNGWKALYLKDVECLAEIPPTVPAVKKQQSRWASGSIRTFRKLARRVLTDRRLTFGQKLESVIHLSFYSVHPLMLSAYLVAVIASLLDIRLVEFDVGQAVTAATIKAGVQPDLAMFEAIWRYIYGLSAAFWEASLQMPQWVALNITIVFCAVSMWIFYAHALHAQGMRLKGQFKALGALGLIGFGISLSNTIAVAQGIFGRDSGVFNRTPKYRIEQKQDTWRDKKYQIKVDKMVLLEIFAGTLGAVSIIRAYLLANYGIIPILALYTVAYLYIARITLKEGAKTK
jgi:cellulose synthase/poly-beta-1,6-N-acetylglucosamine synthase-like glycosyltransferase